LQPSTRRRDLLGVSPRAAVFYCNLFLRRGFTALVPRDNGEHGKNHGCRSNRGAHDAALPDFFAGEIVFRFAVQR
jgi:hypothetical protein